jgi:hypothetical protein
MLTPRQAALEQVGVVEEPKGSNWGPIVKQYLRAVGILVPAPWCMAFVVWCFRQAGADPKKIPPTASCSFLLHWAKEQGKLTDTPLPGDIFLLLRKGGQTAFHCGIVDKVSDWRIWTIEGNSNPGGSPEGYEVVKRIRWKSARTSYVRILLS